MTAGRTAEEWGRIAVSLPGWRWMPGMLACHGSWSARVVERKRTGGARLSGGGDVGHGCWPDPDDSATAGCLLALLSDTFAPLATGFGDGFVVCLIVDGTTIEGTGSTLGRACIAAAEALGRWPNLAESGQKGAE